MRFLAAEIIRERILRVTRDEVPHAIAILIDSWEEKPRLTRIAATIHVEREGQKAILIGNGGARSKKSAPKRAPNWSAWSGRKFSCPYS